MLRDWEVRLAARGLPLPAALRVNDSEVVEQVEITDEQEPIDVDDEEHDGQAKFPVRLRRLGAVVLEVGGQAGPAASSSTSGNEALHSTNPVLESLAQECDEESDEE